MTPTNTAEAAVSELARMACDECIGTGRDKYDRPCSYCHGKPVRFAQLRKKCHTDIGQWVADWCDGTIVKSPSGNSYCSKCSREVKARHKEYGGFSHQPCCQGVGWLPVSVEKAGTEAEKMPEFDRLQHVTDGYNCYFRFSDGLAWSQFAPTAAEAKVLAWLRWARETSDATN